jgi:hypothetical protein
MARIRPRVVMTTAAPVVAPVLPSACALVSACESALKVSAWSCEFRLVTRSLPGLGGDCLPTLVTWPAALTDSTCRPGTPRSCWSYWASRPAWPTRSTPEKPVMGRCRFAISCPVIGCKYPSSWAASVA